MSYLDLTLIARTIDEVGEVVTVEVFSNESYSPEGDLISQSTTMYDVKAIFNSYGEDSRYGSEGQFQETKFSFFFKGTQTGIDENNIIERSDGERWIIKRNIKHSFRGSRVVQEAQVTNL